MDLIQFCAHNVLIITWGHLGYFTSPVAAIKNEHRFYICPLRKLSVHAAAVDNFKAYCDIRFLLVGH